MDWQQQKGTLNIPKQERERESVCVYSNAIPVISEGIGRPIMFKIVGATSQRAGSLPFGGLKTRLCLEQIKGTGAQVCAVCGWPSEDIIISAFP